MEYTGDRNSKGEPNGQGTMTFADGHTYTGEFKDNLFNGQGTMKYPSGATYTGAFKADKFNGQGTYTATDGSTHTGEWKDGLPAP